MPRHRTPCLRASRAARAASATLVAALGIGLALAAYAGPGGDHAAAQSNCSTSHDAMDAVELEVLALINAERARAGAPPLLPSVTLARAAAWMSEDIVENRNWAHTDSLGRPFHQRLRDCGMSGGYWGENLGIAGSAAAVVSGWMGSSGHRANMLNPQFAYAGVGYYEGAWTLDLSSSDATGAPVPGLPSVSPTPTATPTATPSPAALLAPAKAIVPLIVVE